jgi:hypothetical protein
LFISLYLIFPLFFCLFHVFMFACSNLSISFLHM